MAKKLPYVYLYVKKEDFDECFKYGIKLSKYNQKTLNINGFNKKFIIAYLSPKDSEKYTNSSYSILRVKLYKYNVFIQNLDNQDEICKIENYIIGSYSNPIVLINSSIMPENLFKYNKILDVPLLIENSKQFYLDRIKEKEIEIESSNYKFCDLLKK